jgi:hypothetical protein
LIKLINTRIMKSLKLENEVNELFSEEFINGFVSDALGLTVGITALPRRFYFISNREVLHKLYKSVIHYLGPKAVYPDINYTKLSINGLVFYLAEMNTQDYSIALKLI